MSTSTVSIANDLTLGPADVLVLGLSLEDADAAKFRPLLDEGERARAGRFVSEVHRQRFTVAHAALRLALAHVVGQAPQSLRFRQGAFGKPALAGCDLDIRFNLSHSGDRALIAFSLGREVGIDIEQERPVEPLDLARMCFSARERAALQRFAAAEQVAAFFRGWTRKESLIKANGRGFSYPLDRFDVSLDESPASVLIPFPTADESEGRWEIRSLDVDIGFAAALTVGGPDWRLVHRQTSIRELQELGC